MTAIETKSLQVAKVGKYVDTNHVNTLIRNYKQERWRQNSESIGKEDTLSVRYTLEELEEFIAKAKRSGANGIRLYFGVYPENYAPNPLMSKQQTVVFVATKNTDLEDGGYTEKNVYVQAEDRAEILAYNYGSICPIWCGTKKPMTEGDDDGFGGLGITIVDRGEKGLTII
ncbi:hypothetical protein HHL16_05670 [Pseudoflavitalea sp. G-6-1-2]|uniref:hypothetical protein n=1 Tax=Pseudoflavitalea sp. G-6-1-2 TaxID=2728841 RepID=UPI00146D40DF|nr:hypothetical protein [Pseudoflavitalea sp. G-6-1-2]NML20350.1 hypothetical protein [Pseudoflavitalea sp. G-6-1-2]